MHVINTLVIYCGEGNVRKYAQEMVIYHFNFSLGGRNCHQPERRLQFQFSLFVKQLFIITFGPAHTRGVPYFADIISTWITLWRVLPAIPASIATQEEYRAL